MRSGFLYTLQADNKPRVNKFRLKSLLFFVVVLLFGSQIRALATAPFFVGGSPRYLTVCPKDTVDIGYLLTATDTDPDQTLIWSIAANPFNGSVLGLDATAPSGVAVTPTGVRYIVDSGATNDLIQISVDDGSQNPAIVTIFVTVTQHPSLKLGANPAVCAGDTVAFLSYDSLQYVGPDTARFTVAGFNSWTVPTGVDSIHFDVQGARGGRQNATPPPYAPGAGGRVQGTLLVTPGQSLDIIVGGVGGDGAPGGAAGGFNGGGATSFYVYGSGGGGGGSSDIWNSGTPLVIAGGGGGDGWDSTGTRAGGSGGGLTGGSSATNGGGSLSNYSAGGSQAAGGAGATYPGWPSGSDGIAYQGGDGSSQGISGGGGGGYFGGGGGVWTGGGGGSSYTNAGLVPSFTHTQGYDTSGGRITLTYNIPGTYSIVWSAAAHTAGFADVTGTMAPSPFKLVVPSAAPSAVYSATLTVSSTACMSAMNTFNVTVNPIPFVNVVDSQSVCNGDSTEDVTFAGGPLAPTFNWVNDNPDIGLPVNGTGKIAKFLPINPFTYPVVATIIVTPTENGCIGASRTFTITDKPIPVLNSTLTPPAICDSTLFHYEPTSATASTEYTWSRATVAGVANTATSGTNNIDETLDNTVNFSVPVVYEYILNFQGCMDTQNVTVNVYPTPILTSAHSAVICSETEFDYTPESNVESAVSTWSRETVPGISNIGMSGSGNPGEVLINTTDSAVVTDYVFTLTVSDGGTTCSYTQDVTLTVNPTPMLNTPLIAGANCTRDTFTYVPGSTTIGTGFTWTRDTTEGLTNSPASDSGIIHELLVNPGADPVIVTYTYSLTASGCSHLQSVTDTVKPTPMLSSTLTPDSICSNTLFAYSALSNTAGTSFAWVRDSISGIVESADSAMSAVVSEILINSTAGIIPVIYRYTLTAEGCANTQNVTVNVNPTPVLSNNPSVATICDNTFFNYTPTSGTSGAIYSWTRLYVPGVANFTASGTGTDGVINDSLNNTTYVNVDVTYTYVITANGCTNTEDVTLTVHPDPKLNTDSTAVTCSGAMFEYYPDSYTPTTTFTWSNPVVPGVTPTGVSDSGFISGVLTSTLTTAAEVVYTYTLTAYGCTNTQTLIVTVNPSPLETAITVHPSGNECDNTMYQNFGAAVPPPAGVHYNWVAENGEVWAIGESGQYCIVNFTTPGNALVYLLINNISTGCGINSPFPVTVSTAPNINPEVIYFNGQFICKDADVDNYQWGYDDKVNIDSTAIIGANDQNYAIAAPDTINKWYWVITNRGGCTQKTYFRTPGTTNGIYNVNAGQLEMKVYPNPAAQFINVELLNIGTGSVNIAVTNMLGQNVSSMTATDNKAKIDVAGLPVGCYMVDCYRDGIKIATAKFIKN